jgi:hypothetical protein
MSSKRLLINTTSINRGMKKGYIQGTQNENNSNEFISNPGKRDAGTSATKVSLPPLSGGYVNNMNSKESPAFLFIMAGF